MWEPIKYRIATTQGDEVVDGIAHVESGIGIHFEVSGKFSITHIASGRRITKLQYAKDFSNGVRFVEQISDVIDWKAEKPDIEAARVYVTAARDKWDISNGTE